MIREWHRIKRSNEWYFLQFWIAISKPLLHPFKFEVINYQMESCMCLYCTDYYSKVKNYWQSLKLQTIIFPSKSQAQKNQLDNFLPLQRRFRTNSKLTESGQVVIGISYSSFGNSYSILRKHY